MSKNIFFKGLGIKENGSKRLFGKIVSVNPKEDNYLLHLISGGMGKGNTKMKSSSSLIRRKSQKIFQKLSKSQNDEDCSVS